MITSNTLSLLNQFKVMFNNYTSTLKVIKEEDVKYLMDVCFLFDRCQILNYLLDGLSLKEIESIHSNLVNDISNTDDTGIYNSDVVGFSF